MPVIRRLLPGLLVILLLFNYGFAAWLWYTPSSFFSAPWPILLFTGALAVSSALLLGYWRRVPWWLLAGLLVTGIAWILPAILFSDVGLPAIIVFLVLCLFLLFRIQSPGSGHGAPNHTH